MVHGGVSIAKKSDKLRLEVDSEKLMGRKDANTKAGMGVIVGLMFGLALFCLQLPVLNNTLVVLGGPTTMDLFVPLICVGAGGASAAALYFLEMGRSIRELLLARMMKKNYKYGVAVRSDAHGVLEVAKLKKHDEDTFYFTDPRARAPVLVPKPSTDFPVQTHSLDGIEVVLVSSTDATPAKVNGETAATKLLGVVYETAPLREPMYVYEKDADGNYIVNKDGVYQRKVIGEQEIMKPVYPQMSRIPKSKIQSIGDMVFDAEYPEKLFNLALENVIMESTTYEVPETTREPMLDEKGEPVVDEAGQQKFVEKPVIAPDGTAVYRKAEAHEVAELKKANAIALAKEAMDIRKKLAVPDPDSGRSLLNVLYSFVVRRWMQGEMADLKVQARNQVDSEMKDKHAIEKQVDNGTVIMTFAAVCLLIVLGGLKAVGVI